MSRLRGLIGALATASCGLLLLGWAVGRACTDRWLLTQFVWWVPAWVWLGAAIMALALTALAPRRDRPAKRGRARHLRIVLAVCLLGAAGYSTIVEYRLLASRAAPAPDALRLLVWNPASGPISNLGEQVTRGGADLIAVANSSFVTDWVPVMNAMGPTVSALKSGRMVVVSRYPITEWGAGSMKVTGAKERTFKWNGGQKVSIDEGYAVYFVLRLGDGSALTAWFLDLPSDPDIPRLRMMRETRAAIDSFRGPRYRRTADDRDELVTGGTAGVGFPEPDLIFGDFNTPRGSASLDVLTGGLPSAFEQAGRGISATWPRRSPVLAIDHCFVGPAWRATVYAPMEMGAGEHLAQWCQLERNGAAQQKE